MDDVRIGRYLRALRLRRELTQTELGRLAGLSQPSVSLVERGHLDALALRTVRELFAALDARFEGLVTWRGGAIDRLLDERHATLVEAVVRMLGGLGWSVKVEVSFNHYGDRGSIDVLAFHPSARAALVVEVKSDLTVVEETARRLDVKVRLAPAIVEREFGVAPAATGRLLVLPRSATAWRRVQRVRATLDAILPGRATEARQWLASPTGSFASVLFVSASNRGSARNGSSTARAAPRACTPRRRTRARTK